MSTQWQKSVQDFHEKFGVPVGEQINMDERELRAKLILEEAVETVAAMGYFVEASFKHYQPLAPIAYYVSDGANLYDGPDIVETVDGLADLIYVTLGAAVSFGVDLEPIFDEVHRTNMAKVGGATREDGKVLKPEGWQPPDIATLLTVQQYQQLDSALARLSSLTPAGECE